MAAIKLHTLLDIRTSIPTFIYITSGKVHIQIIFGKVNSLIKKMTKDLFFLTNNFSLTPDTIAKLYKTKIVGK